MTDSSGQVTAEALLTSLREHTMGWRSTSDEAWERDPICLACRMSWPCEPSQSADEIERLRTDVQLWQEAICLWRTAVALQIRYSAML